MEQLQTVTVLVVKCVALACMYDPLRSVLAWHDITC